MIPIIGLFYTGPNAVNLSTAAILLDRTISLFSVLVFGGIVFLIAFGRQTTTKPKKIYLDNMDRA